MPILGGRCDEGLASLVREAQSFYDSLAERYHLLFGNWDSSVQRQGAVLDALIATELGPGQRRVLDVACGIGTQALGLAALGHSVHGTDLSPKAVSRLLGEAARLGVTIPAAVHDMRTLDRLPGEFDVVLACDNAVPHLLSDADLDLAVRGMRARLVPRGLLLLSQRDYDDLAQSRPRADTPRVFDEPGGGRRIIFQVWDWGYDARTYVVHQYMVLERPSGERDTFHSHATYRALLRHELNAALAAAGFCEIRWRFPEETGYYQPIVTARRP
ncbi:MAG: class I SAM-dependent methyltransferase [Chloroflexota bacterium]